MKYLAEGFEYKVYLIENSRVFKKKINYLNRLFKIFKITRKRKFSLIQSCIKSFVSDRKNSLALIEIKKRLKTIPNQLFANPVFIKNSLNFTQDFVITVDEYLKSSDTQEMKRVVDDHIRFQETLWTYSVHDGVYKFQSNYGINSSGKLVCIDFGEYIFTKDEVLKNIEKHKWLNRTSYKNWSDKEVKDYYTKKMEESITKENLCGLWGSNL